MQRWVHLQRLKYMSYIYMTYYTYIKSAFSIHILKPVFNAKLISLWFNALRLETIVGETKFPVDIKYILCSFINGDNRTT